MAMLKEERKALRDELERSYGIELRIDDELLPVLHFISDSTKRIEQHHIEARNSISELASAGRDAKSFIGIMRKDIQKVDKSILEFQATLNKVKIPEKIQVQQIKRFEPTTVGFLWRYFTISLGTFMLVIICSSAWIYNLNQDLNNLQDQRTHLEREYAWLLKYYTHMKTEAPALTQQFKKRNPIRQND